MKRAEQAEVMISALRSAGAKGIAAVDLFDVGVTAPYEVAELVNQRPGFSVMAELEDDGAAGGGWKTYRFTLMLDGDPQDCLFEGETGSMLTYLERAAA